MSDLDNAKTREFDHVNAKTHEFEHVNSILLIKKLQEWFDDPNGKTSR